MNSNPVTERDFRMPEFRDAKPEDYEFRSDGKIVRKDRWEQGILKIANRLDMTGRREGFEIEDVIKRVEELNDENRLWIEIEEADFAYQAAKTNPPKIDLKLVCGSILRDVTRAALKPQDVGTFTWNDVAISPEVVAFARFDFSETA